MSNLRIPDSLLLEIKELASADMVQIIGEDMDLRRVGREYKGLCFLPGHEDSKPSFSVIPHKNKWYCHPCGRGGDIFDYLRLRRGLEWIDVVRELGERYGKKIPSPEDNPGARQLSVEEVRRQQGLDVLAAIVSLTSDRKREEGTLPPLRELIPQLRKLGFSGEQMASVGITRGLTRDPQWLDGGRVVWVKERGRVLAIRPATRDRSRTLGLSGKASGGWVNRDRALQAARSRDGLGRLYIAADVEGFRYARDEYGIESTLPIGKISALSLERTLPPGLLPVVIFTGDEAGHHRGRKIATRLTTLAPRLGMVDLAGDVPAAIEYPPTLVEWQMDKFRTSGVLETARGHQAAERWLEALIESIPEEYFLERDTYQVFLQEIQEKQTLTRPKGRSH